VMVKINKSRIIFLLISIIFITPIGSATAEEKCEFNRNKLVKDFYVSLYKMNSPNAAKNVINQVEPCVSNKYQAAIVTDMYGDIFRHGFKKTKKADLADKAESMYHRALTFESKHDEIIYWHLSLLMREKNDLDSAIKYINEALKIQSDDPVPYLSTALVLSVDAGHWEEAKKLVDILINRKKDYYLSVPLLLATVKTLCYYDKKDIAQIFVSNVEKHRKDMRKSQLSIFEKSKSISQNCTKQ